MIATDLNEAFVNWSQLPGVNVYDFSQFAVMGAYLELHEKETVFTQYLSGPNICPVFGEHKHSTCAQWVPPGTHLGWRPCGYNLAWPRGLPLDDIPETSRPCGHPSVQNLTGAAILTLVLLIGEEQLSLTNMRLQPTSPPLSPPLTSFLSSPIPWPFQDNVTFLQDHHVRQSPLVAKGRLLHVHHACVHGGHNGLVVPHLGGVLSALAQDEDENAFSRPEYYPGSSLPVASIWNVPFAVPFSGSSHSHQAHGGWTHVFPQLLATRPR